MSKLVIVESPSKAKTIKKYLGEGYDIVASAGHVRDLPSARLCVDIKDNFRPKYSIIKGKEKLSVITDAMRIAGTDMQSGKLGSLKNGSEVIVDSGVAKLSDKVSFAGSIATMDRCLRVLCNDFGIDLPTASVMLSLTPAKRMGADGKKGSIEVGKDADLVLVDKKLNVLKVMAGGKIFKGN